jgi:nicotinamidase-related amidase
MVRGLDRGQKAALLISEMQRGVVDAGMAKFKGLAAEVAAKGVAGHIAALAKAFRARGWPVVHCHVAHRPDFGDVLPNNLITAMALKERAMMAGTAEVEAVPELVPEPGDYVFVRSAGLVPFYDAQIDPTLRRLNVQTIVATGVSTNVALSGLTLGAVDRGYQVIIPDDCAAGASPEAHAQMLDNQLRLLATISTAQDIIAAL